MLRLLALKSASSRKDLALLLNFKPAAITHLLYRVPPQSKYAVFQIPKRSGGTREIAAPIPQLKMLQRNLATLLQDCWDDIILANHRKDRIAHGFKRGRSIVTNARRHRNRNYVFNADLKDFFPSINFGRVRGYLMKNKDFALNESVATTIAQIACHQNALPQGSPCSPVISNLIAHALDMQLAVLATKAGCTYSRYADDLTFSTNKAEFPAEIAERTPTNPHTWVAGKSLVKIVLKNGFTLNPSKTRVQYHDSRQTVTGLVVNRGVNTPWDYRNTVRPMVHNLLRKGSFEISDHNGMPQPGTTAQLHGMLSFIDSIDLQASHLAFLNSERGKAFNKPDKRLTVRDFGAKAEFGSKDKKGTGESSARERQFRRFLIYRDFYAAVKPVLLCEGETDNIYLLHAIHSLAAKFPSLVGPPKKGESRLKVRLYKYVQTRTGRILQLGDGGGSPLATFIKSYLHETETFLAPKSAHPFIVLIDNDSGASSINSLLKKKNVLFANTDAFVHVTKNLYVMRTPPLPGKKQTTIEDFFDATTLAMKFEGKSFNTGKDFDNTLYFGKTIFAHKVIRPNADSIDFSGFEPLLKIIVDIQIHYSAVLAAEAKP